MKGKASVDGELACEGEFTFSLVDQGGGNSGAQVHPTAIIHPSAKIATGCQIGKFVVIGPEVEIGENTIIEEHVVINKWTKLGKNNHIYKGASIGTPPQDLHYKGEKGEIIIGDSNTIREFVTIHLPVGEGGKTIIGDKNYIMIHAHIPHNCKVGNEAIIGGYVGLAGYTEIGDQAIIAGLSGIHQFVRIGRLAMIGAQSKIGQDIPPFMLVVGSPGEARGVNSIGMQRRGISLEAQAEIKKAFKIIYEKKQPTENIVEELKKKLRPLDEINQIIEFLSRDSKRGISKKAAMNEIEEDLILPDLPELGI